jgi:transposase, IS30 family
MPMSYAHLSQSERYQIERWLQQGLHIIQIAKLLNRAKSTIYRELKRLTVAYSAAGAVIHRQHCASRSAANAPRIDAAVWQEVKQRLNQRWSPQQIAGRARYLGQPCPSWQAIYGWIGRTWLKLATRPLRRGHKSQSQFGWAHKAMPIAKRPKEVATRAVAGHWELDSMLGMRGMYKTRVLVANERASRYTQMSLMDNGAASTCALLVQRMLLEDKRLPLLSVTVDRGSEFRDLPELLGSRLYVCDPQRPNQRGTNENTIGLIRQYIPKGMPISLINTHQLTQIQIELNSRPRQCLGFKTPAEVLFNLDPRCRTSI